MKRLLSRCIFVILFISQAVATANVAPNCPKTLPTQSEMLQKLQELSAESPQKDYGVGGLFIKKENTKLIDAYRKLVTYKDTKLRPFKDIDFYARFKESPCHKALCAAQTIFGNEMGLVYLYYVAIYGINLSSLGYDRLTLPDPRYVLEFKAWYTVRPWKSLEEMAPMLKAVVNLPQNLIPMTNTRMLHSGIVNPVKSTILANGLITFYTPFDNLGDVEKETITYHELGHTVGTEGQFDISDEWLEAAGWQVQGNQVINLRPEELLSDYAVYKSDCFEDFAETFMYYRYRPMELLIKSPSRYSYMKKYIYKGLEYLTTDACSKVH